MRRLYFASAALLIVVGLGISIAAFFSPPEMLDEQGRLLGEMPPAFAFGLLLAFAGGVLTAVGLAVHIALRLVGRGRRRSG